MSPRRLCASPLLFVVLLLQGPAATAQHTVENEHIRLTLDAKSGGFVVFDKQAGIRWVPAPTWRAAGPFRSVTRLAKPHPGLRFETDVQAGRQHKLAVTVTLTVPKGARDVHVAIAAPAESRLNTITYPPPLVPEKGPSWLAIVPYGSGLLLPLRADGLPRRWWSLDIPFFGVTNIETGWGYACIFKTPDDARMTFRQLGKGKDAPLAACLTWSQSMKKWRYDREALYRFCPSGGYVALAKAYRAYAKQTGILKTLREKAKTKPDVAKLLGAPDVWGANGLKFCQEAKAAGIDRLLVNGSWGVEATEAIKKLGYLVSVYDNYEDMMPGKPGRMGDCKGPEQSPLMWNDKRMLGWPVHVKDPKTGRTKLDPKTGKPVIKEQWLKRCTGVQLPVARRWIPKDQAKHPRNARFLDVTTACGLRECFDPKHYCTRTTDRKHREALARYVGDELGLVLGGEHGRWYGVPIYDYWEGMQSAGFYSWPAGHVGMDLPRSRDAIGKNYLTYGIGHTYRIPLWQLVFGDCTVDYWYWGDSTGHFYHIAPEITAKKDLFNILYASLPLYWVNRPFGLNWTKPKLRERLLDSYRVTCKLHEQIGFDEMLTHEWLTPDRTVQKTTFSGGTTVIVNFGDKVYEHQHDGKGYPISPLGFFAHGPRILQYRIRKDGRDITYIKTPDYLFADAGGKEHDFDGVTTITRLLARATSRTRLLVSPEGNEEGRWFDPRALRRDWDLTTTRVLSLDSRGERRTECQVARSDERGLQLKYTGQYEILCGREYDLPNLSLWIRDLRPQRCKQGEPIAVKVRVRNRGRRKVRNVSVTMLLGSSTNAVPLASKRVTVPARGTRDVDFTLDTRRLDGPRAVRVKVDPENRIAELVEQDNETGIGVVVALDPSRWAHRLKVQVVNGPATQPSFSTFLLKEDPNTGQSLPRWRRTARVSHPVGVALEVDFRKEMARLGITGTFDPGSVRVCKRTTDDGIGEQVSRWQFEPAADFHPSERPTGTVLWAIRSDLLPHQTRNYWLLFDVVENGRKQIPCDYVRWSAGRNWILGGPYRARSRNGCIADVGFLGWISINDLVYSSKQTGWVEEEDGEVLEQKVLANGPVRAIVRVRKKLKAGLVYTKTYTFWPDRIDVHFEGNKAYGVISRAYYALPGTYEDSAGNKATIDGQGNGEGVMGKCPNPKWYVVYADNWAHSCVALSPFSNITYWDSGGSWGGVGFNGGDLKGCRMSYVIHPGQKDGRFGKLDYERLTHPPKVRIVE